MGVTRGSLVTLNTGPLISLSLASSCLSCSALVTIVRNFSMVNGCPLSPARRCLKSTGPGDDSRTAKAAIRNNGEVATKSASEPRKSIAPLAMDCHVWSGPVRKTSTGCPANSSTVVCETRVWKKSACSQTSTPSSSQTWIIFSIWPKRNCFGATRTALAACECNKSVSTETENWPGSRRAATEISPRAFCFNASSRRFISRSPPIKITRRRAS